MPVMKFTEAIRDAYAETMRAHPEVFLVGVGIIDPKAVFGTVAGLREEFGDQRFVEGPLAEQMLTGFAFGAAIQGLRPVLIHHRIDFLPLTMDQIVNHMAKWRYMFGGQQNVPVVVRGIVGRGWGNGPQHTQSLQNLFIGIPGLKVVVPSNPADAKGLMVSAILDDEPVIFIDFRWLHNDEGEVPTGLHKVPLGKAAVVRAGADCTVVSVGPMVQESVKAADMLALKGIHVEVLDLRTIRPIDYPTILTSVEKTGHLVVADPDWPTGGVASVVIEHVAKNGFNLLKRAPKSVTWPDHPVPASYAIEKNYYPMAAEIANVVTATVHRTFQGHLGEATTKDLAGPF